MTRPQLHQEITVDTLVQELDEARKLALRTDQPAAAVAATLGKATLLGLIPHEDRSSDYTSPVRLTSKEAH